MTGYALRHDVWDTHTWVVGGETLYETTCRFDRYFGVALPPLLALKFWWENVAVGLYPRGIVPPAFWEARPGLVTLRAELHRLSPEEVDRQLEGVGSRHRLTSKSVGGRCG